MCALLQSFPEPLSLHAPYFEVPASFKNVTQSSGDRRLRIQTRPSGLFFCFPLASKLESGIGTRSSAPSFLSGLDIPTRAMTTTALQRFRRFSVFASIESPCVCVLACCFRRCLCADSVSLAHRVALPYLPDGAVPQIRRTYLRAAPARRCSDLRRDGVRSLLACGRGGHPGCIPGNAARHLCW